MCIYSCLQIKASVRHSNLKELDPIYGWHIAFQYNRNKTNRKVW
uniref:Uncharacterized protein n=1 Tax=Rhizophora mucronata TaxID=61149 RepID=A0A2P2NVT3_RHIMU